MRSPTLRLVECPICGVRIEFGDIRLLEDGTQTTMTDSSLREHDVCMEIVGDRAE